MYLAIAAHNVGEYEKAVAAGHEGIRRFPRYYGILEEIGTSLAAIGAYWAREYRPDEREVARPSQQRVQRGRERSAISEAEIRRRHLAARQQITQALIPYGYYQPEIDAKLKSWIAGLSSLPDVLNPWRAPPPP